MTDRRLRTVINLAVEFISEFTDNDFQHGKNMLMKSNFYVIALALCLVVLPNVTFGQGLLDNNTFFATDQGLFERVNGQTVQIPTPPSTAFYFPISHATGDF